MIHHIKTAAMLFPVLKKSFMVRQLSRLRQLSAIEFLKKYSTQTPETEVTVKEKIQLSKPTVTKWKRPPFVKNFFVGKFDTELLAFPEILNQEQLDELERTVKSINFLYKEKVNSFEIDENKTIPKDLLQDLKDLGLFGRMIPAKYGGMDLTNTAFVRLNEVLGLDWSIAATLAVHENFAAQAIMLFGTEEQKLKYLPNLASGRCMAALCCSESKSGNDLWSMETQAVQQSDEKSFLLHGSKSWVTNAQSADYFIVFAKVVNHLDTPENQITCFIVDKDTEGLVVEPYDKTSLHGIETAMVRFKEIAVPSSNMLGELGIGFQIHWKILESFRFALNTCSMGVLKSLLDSVTEYAINTERLERSLGDIQLVRERLSKIATTIYAMESMSYFTAALMDSTENPDVTLETTIVKVFNSEATLFCLREMIKALGSSCLLKEQQMERFYRDAQALAMFDGSNDIARLAIGLTGYKYVGFKKAEKIVKLRNPFQFPKDSMATVIKRFRVMAKRYKYHQDLAGHIHPSLVEHGNHLEESIMRFEVVTENVLGVHGSKIIETQFEPKRTADIAIDLYAMTAVLVRCSRSYCIGLQNAEHEIRIGVTFCQEAYKRICDNLDAIAKGPSFNNDSNNLQIGGQIIDWKGYFPEHPLKYNF